MQRNARPAYPVWVGLRFREGDNGGEAATQERFTVK